MQINFVEVGTCRGNGYSSDGAVDFGEFRTLVTNWSIWSEPQLEEALDKLPFGLANILGGHQNLVALLSDLEAGKVCVGDTEEGSYALGFVSLEELAKAAKLQFAESMLGQ